MRIVSKIPTLSRDPLPPGKLTLRWVRSRCMVQAYVAGRYLLCASGQDEEEAMEQLGVYYKDDGREVWARDANGPYVYRKERSTI